MKLKELLNEVVATTHAKNKRDVKDVTDAGLLLAKLGAIKSGEQAAEFGKKAKGVPPKAVKDALKIANDAWDSLQNAPENTPERDEAFRTWKDAGTSLCKALEKVMDDSIAKAAKDGNKVKRTPPNMPTSRDFANAWVGSK